MARFCFLFFYPFYLFFSCCILHPCCIPSKSKQSLVRVFLLFGFQALQESFKVFLLFKELEEYCGFLQVFRMGAKRETNYSLVAVCPSSKIKGKQSCRLRKYCLIVTKDNLYIYILHWSRGKVISSIDLKVSGSILREYASNHFPTSKWCKRGDE